MLAGETTVSTSMGGYYEKDKRIQGINTKQFDHAGETTVSTSMGGDYKKDKRIQGINTKQFAQHRPRL